MKLVEEKWKDLLGQEINVGDRITYGTLFGRCGGLATGTVLEYVRKPVGSSNVSLKVQRDGGSGWQRSGEYKPGYLQYPDRIIVITKLAEVVT